MLLILLFIAMDCVMLDGLCIAASDVSSYEAIRALHAHLDDDQSGDIDISESVEFLREELNYTKGFEKRQKAFHHNNDQHISVHELWDIWLSNEVHNWTVEQTVGWLHVCVELGQYADVFYENAINGSLLPRLATNNEQFLTRILGIKNPTHRSKISIKAMDIVLFGPPKGSLVKDIFIASLIFVIVVMVFKFRQMNRNNIIVVDRMGQDMETLQEELRRFHEEKLQEEKNHEADQGEQQPDVREDSPPSEAATWEDDVSIFRLRDSPEWDATSLDLQSKNELQLWLQLTHEKEKVVLDQKIKVMTLQFQEAKEMCEKLKPSRKNLFGALSFIHGKIESKGQSIYQARNALTEIQTTNKEMEIRWNAMEQLLGFTIRQNAGLVCLESLLERNLQASIIHHPANTAGGLASAGLERRAETPSSTRNRFSCPTDTFMRRKISSVRGGSIKSDANLESNFDSPLLFSFGSTRSLRLSSIQPSLQQSHTVGSGLSNYESESYRPRSSSSESKVRKLSSARHPAMNGSKDGTNGNNINGYSTDETDSGKFTIGESGTIKINSSSVRFRENENSTPTHSPSAPSLQESTKDEPQRPSIEKVRTQRKRLHLLGKSYSHDDNGSYQTDKEKNIGKFSSEPSLETKQSCSQPPQDPHPSSKPFARGLLPKAKWISKKLKKTDKSNK